MEVEHWIAFEEMKKKCFFKGELTWESSRGWSRDVRRARTRRAATRGRGSRRRVRPPGALWRPTTRPTPGRARRRGPPLWTRPSPATPPPPSASRRRRPPPLWTRPPSSARRRPAQGARRRATPPTPTRFLSKPIEIESKMKLISTEYLALDTNRALLFFSCRNETLWKDWENWTIIECGG